ncbi:hypothetical protein VPH35_020760 [Triticum aestivum]
MACGGEVGPGARREGAVAAAANGGEVLGGDEEKREEKRAGEELLRRDCSGDQSARSCRCKERSWRGRGRVTVRGEVDDFGLARRRQSRGGGRSRGDEKHGGSMAGFSPRRGIWFDRCKEARDP